MTQPSSYAGPIHSNHHNYGTSQTHLMSSAVQQVAPPTQPTLPTVPLPITTQSQAGPAPNQAPNDNTSLSTSTNQVTAPINSNVNDNQEQAALNASERASSHVVPPAPFDSKKFVRSHFASSWGVTRKALMLPVSRLSIEFFYEFSNPEQGAAAAMTYETYQRPLGYFVHLLHPLSDALRREVESVIAEDMVCNLSPSVRIPLFDPAHEKSRITTHIRDQKGRWVPRAALSNLYRIEKHYPLVMKDRPHAELLVRVRMLPALWNKTNMEWYHHYGGLVINMGLEARPLQLAILRGECPYLDRTYCLRELYIGPQGSIQLTPLSTQNETHSGDARYFDSDGLPLAPSAYSDHLPYEVRIPQREITNRDALAIGCGENIGDNSAKVLCLPFLAGETNEERVARARRYYKETRLAFIGPQHNSSNQSGSDSSGDAVSVTATQDPAGSTNDGARTAAVQPTNALDAAEATPNGSPHHGVGRGGRGRGAPAARAASRQGRC